MTEQLAESLHRMIDANAARMHQALEELVARYSRPEPVPCTARICVDAGHGGEDPGAVVGQIREADLVIEYAHELERALSARGHQVILTRSEDAFISLSGRAAVSNTFAADAFVSLHANFASNTAAEGAWILYAEGSRLGKTLAREIFAHLVEIPGIGDADPEEEVYPDASSWVGGRRLAVLRKTFAPAVLLELGFLSNAGDLAQLLDVDTRKRVSLAIAMGLEAWLGRKTL